MTAPTVQTVLSAAARHLSRLIRWVERQLKRGSDSQGGDSPSPRIGYVLKRWPRLSETFIVQEVLQMEQRRADIVLFAIMDPHESVTNPLVGEVRAPVIYLQRTFWRQAPLLALDHLILAFTSPRRYGTAFRHLRRSSGTRASIRQFAQSGGLARRVRAMGITHLHAHFAHNPASIARYASQMTGVPFSFTAHAKDLYLTRPESIANKAELASFITTCTGYNAQYLREILPADSARKVNVVYHGVDTRRFQPSGHTERRAVPRLLAIGRLVPKKGFDCLIEAAQRLHDESIPFHLDIYGGGPLRDDLQRRIDRNGLGHQVQLCGATTQHELLQAYADADLFVLAPQVTPDGDRDGIPNVILEAMACGLPVVSTDISGIPEVVIDGVNGRLVPSADAGALAEALRDLLASDETRRAFGREARQTVCRKFDADVNAEAMAALLRERGLQCG